MLVPQLPVQEWLPVDQGVECRRIVMWYDEHGERSVGSGEGDLELVAEELAHTQVCKYRQFDGPESSTDCRIYNGCG